MVAGAKSERPQGPGNEQRVERDIEYVCLCSLCGNVCVSFQMRYKPTYCLRAYAPLLGLQGKYTFVSTYYEAYWESQSAASHK